MGEWNYREPGEIREDGLEGGGERRERERDGGREGGETEGTEGRRDGGTEGRRDGRTDGQAAETRGLTFWVYNSIQFNSIQFNSIQFNSIQFNSIQFNSIQFNSIQFNSIQFNSIQFNIYISDCHTDVHINIKIYKLLENIKVLHMVNRKKKPLHYGTFNQKLLCIYNILIQCRLILGCHFISLLIIAITNLL